MRPFKDAHLEGVSKNALQRDLCCFSTVNCQLLLTDNSIFIFLPAYISFLSVFFVILESFFGKYYN